MSKDFLTRNLGLKLSALALAVVLWLVARLWLVK